MDDLFLALIWISLLSTVFAALGLAAEWLNTITGDEK